MLAEMDKTDEEKKKEVEEEQKKKDALGDKANNLLERELYH
jgi:hypothetical protein